MKTIDARTETIEAMAPLWIESCAELGADGPLLDDIQLHRQLARGER